MEADDAQREVVESCYICGSTGVGLYPILRDRLFTAPTVGGSDRCPACGLHWLNPRLRREHIGLAYRDYYTHAEPAGARRLTWLRRWAHGLVEQEALGKRGAQTVFERLLAYLLRRVPLVVETAEPLILELRHRSPGRLLDIGCGDGSLLGKMKAYGWDVSGIEPDRVSAEHAREQWDVQIYAGRLEDVDLSAQSHDIVVCRHVIEHVYDPVAFLRRAFSLVAPGGRMILQTPNLRSLGHHVFNSAWFHLDPPRHLFLFDAGTVIACAAQAGLPRAELRSLAREARMTWQQSRLIASDGVARHEAPLRYKIEGLGCAMVEAVKPPS